MSRPGYSETRNLLVPQDTFFVTPSQLAQAQLEAMLQETTDFGCSKKRLAPINATILLAYREFGEEPSVDTIVDYDPFTVLPAALMKVTGAARLTRYDRTFKPGESEGTHTDEHDIVVTYTHMGKADFTIAAPQPFNAHKLGPHNIIMFNGRLPHEVSSPLQKGARAITAFAVDL